MASTNPYSFLYFSAAAGTIFVRTCWPRWLRSSAIVFWHLMRIQEASQLQGAGDNSLLFTYTLRPLWRHPGTLCLYCLWSCCLCRVFSFRVQGERDSAHLRSGSQPRFRSLFLRSPNFDSRVCSADRPRFSNARKSNAFSAVRQFLIFRQPITMQSGMYGHWACSHVPRKKKYQLYNFLLNFEYENAMIMLKIGNFLPLFVLQLGKFGPV